MSITGNATITGNGVITFITTGSGSGSTGPAYLTPDDPTLELFYPFLTTDICGNKLGNHKSISAVAYDASLNYTPTIGTTNSFATGRSYININSSSTQTPIKLPSILFNKVYTVCFWCKCSRTATNGDQVGIVIFNTSIGGAQGYGFTNFFSSTTVSYPFIGGWQFNERFNPATTLNSNDGNWHHYCLVANKGTGDILYIDGVYYGSVSRNGDYSTWVTKTMNATLYNITLDKFYLGNLWWNAPSYLNGSLGDFRMYGKELNALEIKNLYNSGTIKPATTYLPPTLSTYSFISTSIFTYTGSNQSIVVPATANRMIVSCWGAGGASMGAGNNDWNPLYLNSVGGGGGFTQAVFNVSSANQSSYNVIVGGKGVCCVDTPAPGGFGGGGGATTWSGISPGNTSFRMRSGGGRSALLYNSNDIITAGGGGAGGGSWKSVGGVTMNGGAGGGLTGGSADGTTGTGGTQTTGGTGTAQSGSKYQGGNSGDINSPGGGGYYGGGCTAYLINSNNGYNIYGGGGGSSYIDSSTVATALGFTNTITQAAKSVPPNISSLPENIVSNTIGYGGATGGFDGGHGLVVISFYT